MAGELVKWALLPAAAAAIFVGGGLWWVVASVEGVRQHVLHLMKGSV